MLESTPSEHLAAPDLGWLDGVRRIVSPNCDARPPATAVSLLVIHAISLPPQQFGSDDIIRLFTNTLDPQTHPYFATIATLKVSAHFLIRRDGELIQFVSCQQRAWHAGVSHWAGQARCNDFSIGVELEGCDEHAFSHAQYAALSDLVPRLCAHYPIRTVVGHSDIAPGRKTDPGPCFDWPRVRAMLAPEIETAGVAK
ncbi:MAG: 1,6-anhydro-N-acetylmuramyl-L-alanine amidase AmpD [Pseudomonadota bacterium]